MATTLTNKDNLDKLKKEYKQIEETRNKREGYTNISGLEGLQQQIAIESQKFKDEDTKFLENPSKLCCSMRDDDRTPVLNSKEKQKCETTNHYIPLIRKKLFANCMLNKMKKVKYPEDTEILNLFNENEIMIINQFIELKRNTFDPIKLDNLIKKLYEILDILPKDIDLSDLQVKSKISKEEIIENQRREPKIVVEPKLNKKDTDIQSLESEDDI